MANIIIHLYKYGNTSSCVNNEEQVYEINSQMLWQVKQAGDRLFDVNHRVCSLIMLVTTSCNVLCKY
jgi:hypothetical protein